MCILLLHGCEPHNTSWRAACSPQAVGLRPCSSSIHSPINVTCAIGNVPAVSLFHKPWKLTHLAYKLTGNGRKLQSQYALGEHCKGALLPLHRQLSDMRNAGRSTNSTVPISLLNLVNDYLIWFTIQCCCPQYYIVHRATEFSQSYTKNQNQLFAQ